MFVIYSVGFNAENVEYKRIKELPTLEEAEIFLREHQGDGENYTVMME